jgi:arsenate reductase (thioredoxin)
MAAALLEHHTAGHVDVRSAGSPADEINPAVAPPWPNRHRSRQRPPQNCSPPDAVRASDVKVTMGCGDPCPVFPGKRYLDGDLTDPPGKTLNEIRPIREDIDE